MKKSLLYLFLIITQGLNAQEVLKTTFHKTERDEEVSAKKSDYSRIIKSSSQGGIYSFTETWKDSSLKREGFVTEYSPKFKQTGKEITYHKNGKIEQIQYVRNQSSIGKIQIFYENGNLKEEGKFLTPTSQSGALRFDYPNYVSVQIADSLGNTFLDASGNGKVSVTYANGDIVEGEYVNGLKNRQHKQFFIKHKETYIEEYQNGKFLKGQYIDGLGKKTSYKDETVPEFKGGIEEFYNFINRNLKYPPAMKSQRIEGKVTINFIVEKDGSLNSIKVLRGVPGGEELGKEAIRVIQLSPKWKPGTQKGKPVRVSYSVPINFALSY